MSAILVKNFPSIRFPVCTSCVKSYLWIIFWIANKSADFEILSFYVICIRWNNSCRVWFEQIHFERHRIRWNVRYYHLYRKAGIKGVLLKRKLLEWKNKKLFKLFTYTSPILRIVVPNITTESIGMEVYSSRRARNAMLPKISKISYIGTKKDYYLSNNYICFLHFSRAMDLPPLEK